MLALMEFTLRAADRANCALGRVPRRTPGQQRGIDGERIAYFYLRRQGYIVVARQWRHANLDGEIDLIAWEGDRLCFVEVKTRGRGAPVAAELAVSHDKQRTLRRAAAAYIRQLPWSDGEPPRIQPRFDVLSVYVETGERPQVRLLRDAF